MYIIKGTIKGYEDKPPTYFESLGNDECNLNLTVIKSKATKMDDIMSRCIVVSTYLNNEFPWATWEVVELKN